MLMEELSAIQREREAKAFEAGLERYHAGQDAKGQREGYERRDDVSTMVRGAIPLVAEGIEKWLALEEAATRRPATAYEPLKMVDTNTLAYIAVSRVFHHVGKQHPTTSIAEGIGAYVRVQLEAQAIANADKAEAKRYLKLAEGEARASLNFKRHQALVEKLEVDLGWSRTKTAHVGKELLNIVLIALSDIFEIVTEPHEKGTMATVKITQEACGLLASLSEAVAAARPILEPMVVQPRPWTHLNSGCYLDVRLSKMVPMVRTRSKEHRELLKAAIADKSMQPVLEALNALQDTRWAIDTRVLDVIEWTREQGKQPKKSFPLTEVPELPAKIEAEEWETMPKDKRTATSRLRKTVKNIRLAAATNGVVFGNDMATARELAEFEAFYLPHSLDFRGRCYAVPSFNHQRSDHMKGLFRFADGVPLGETGGDWLMIHLANCGDFDKISKEDFPKRIQWVRDNEADILFCARYPTMAYDIWGQADSPFCFLQACFEYDAWMQANFSSEFLSTIPIAADGSCSGLQHYSAITRAEKEAYHVNLIPREDVGDIYKVVAAAAVPTLNAAATGGCELSTIVLAQGFGRSEVKRNVMTYFYGSAQFGMRDQHMEDTMRPLADKVALGELEAHPYSVLTERKNKETGETTWALDGGYSCAQVMAAHTYQAVVSVAPKADEAAHWIQQVAQTLAHESLSLIWTTPMGMPVVQRYSEYETTRIDMWLYDRKVAVPTARHKVDEEGNALARVRVLIREKATMRVAKKQMRSAASPNVIHSMDGAHLQRAVWYASRAGIRDFAMIHDSFGTHAGNIQRFVEITKDALIDTYKDYCPLAEIDRQARATLSEEGREKLPPIPAKGELDLEVIRTSKYAFA